MPYEMEVIHRIYSEDGFYYEVSPDPDGIGNIEIRYFNDVDDKMPNSVICLTEEAIAPLIESLQIQLSRLKNK